MQQVICDCCGKEIKQGSSVRKFEYLCHLDETGLNNGYHDKAGNPTSERLVCYDLCQGCYNVVMSKAVKEFHELSARIQEFLDK